MEEQAIEALALPGSVAADHLSVWNLLVDADPVVKVVIFILVVASFWCWAIIFDKVIRFRRLLRLAERFEEAFWSGGSIEELYDRVGQRPDHPMAAIFAAAMAEWRRSLATGVAGRGKGLTVGLQQRIGQAMQLALAREVDRLERYMGFLATVGSTAPFIGLFGTVWGIMNSFQSIAASKNTSLAVVAPGIAEALFATALGLVAAIPAVIGYNKLSADLDRYEGRLEAFSAEFSSILSRQLEAGED
ncbi:MAG: protein TolQ [Proteobacteria bacterium]|nr:protein TolQ [Pseudomonadota bacterium]